MAGNSWKLQDELNRKTAEHLGILLKEKGLPTAGKKKVLIQWLVNSYEESKSEVKSKPPDDLNYFDPFKEESFEKLNSKR